MQLRQPNNPRGLPKSNRLLWSCFLWFRKHLDELNADGTSLATLLNESVARQLLFILIKVEDEVNAYMVFETLNARGLELSSTDLLKNYLFSRIRVAADLAALQRRWKGLMAVVKTGRSSDFLRYDLLCEQPASVNSACSKKSAMRCKTHPRYLGLDAAFWSPSRTIRSIE